MQPAFLCRHLGATCLMLVAGLTSIAHADTGNAQHVINWAQDQASVRHPTNGERSPLIIIHRGANGYVPEHALGTYVPAVIMGVDYVEPDLVATRDSKLVVRHDSGLGSTTDVTQYPELADRKRTQEVDGVELTGWFGEDPILAELKTLRTVEYIPTIRPGNAYLDDTFEIPTLQEIIDLVKSLQISQQRIIDPYPEIKHSTYSQRLDLATERPLVRTLHHNGYFGPRVPVFIQSFEVNNLRKPKRLTGVRPVQFYGSDQSHDRQANGGNLACAEMTTTKGLRQVACYTYGAGPDKSYVIPRDTNNSLGQPTRFVGDTHAAGLKVHPYTFHTGNSSLPMEFHSADGGPQLRGDLADEIRVYLDAGIDGLFSDQPDVIVRPREQCQRSPTGVRTRAPASWTLDIAIEGLHPALLQRLPPDAPADPPIAFMHGVDRRAVSGFHTLVILDAKGHQELLRLYSGARQRSLLLLARRWIRCQG